MRFSSAAYFVKPEERHEIHDSDVESISPLDRGIAITVDGRVVEHSWKCFTALIWMKAL